MTRVAPKPDGKLFNDRVAPLGVVARKLDGPVNSPLNLDKMVITLEGARP